MTACAFCERPLVVDRQPKRFCGSVCRSRFHEGCRRYAERMFEAGLITSTNIRDAAAKPSTAAGGRPNNSPASGEAN